MGFGRDLGAAVTFGWASTTKQKRAEAEYNRREALHQERMLRHQETLLPITNHIEAMEANFHAASQALLRSDALVEQEDCIVPGWYKAPETLGVVDDGTDVKVSGIASIPAFGLGLGVPAAIWTVVGLTGTAATGTAISTLSGSALSAATAAWIGRAVTLGMGGMTAGRIALGPIGLAASALTLPLGAALAGRKERNYIDATQDNMYKMQVLETSYTTFIAEAKELDPEILGVTADLQRHTSDLEKATPESEEAMKAVQSLDEDMRRCIDIKQRLMQFVQNRDEALVNAGIIEEISE